jgi:hypothetical protein
MSGYFGTEIQQRLQRENDERHATIRVTPGLFHAGRMFGCDDPDRVGWDFIYEHLESDGVFGFRMIPVEQAGEVGEKLASRGYRWDVWDVFTAGREQALAASMPVIEAGLPDSLAELALPTDPDDAIVGRIQQCMADCGVATFSGSMLLGKFAPACTVAVASPGGGIAAVAHSHMPYNSHSRFHRAAWGGLVAVAPTQRGRGLGAYVNARIVVAAFLDLGAERIDELVRPENAASRRMVESCGLRLDPSLKCGAATNASVRFTA